METNSRYELRDDQWERLVHLLPPERTGKKGRPAHDNRNMVNAMLWINRSGAPWRDLPATYGSWKSVHTRFRRWRELGIFERILEQLANEPDEESRMIDATHVRVHQHAAGAKGGASSRQSDDSEAD